MTDPHEKVKLGGFEKYLVIWIPLCMLAGVLLSTYTNAGEIIERGTHQELLEQRGFYYNLYMSQFKNNDDLLLTS